MTALEYLLQQNLVGLLGDMAESAPYKKGELASSQQMISFYCRLDAFVSESLKMESEPHDCFCGESGFWLTPDHPQRTYDGSIKNGYRHAGATARYIAEAVLEKIAREYADEQRSS